MTARTQGWLAVLAGGALIVVGLVGTMRLLTGSPTPAPTPSTGAAAASQSPTPKADPTVTPAPSSSPTAIRTSTPTPDAETAIRAFASQVAAGIAAGDADSLVALLHPLVLERYDEATCRAQFAAGTDPTFAIEVLSVGPLAAWDWTTDDLTTTVPEAWTVEARMTANGETSSQSIHFAPFDLQVRWFSDCGEPLPSP